MILCVTRSFSRASSAGLCLPYSSYRLIPMWKRNQLGYDSAVTSPVGENSSSSWFPSSLCLERRGEERRGEEIYGEVVVQVHSSLFCVIDG